MKLTAEQTHPGYYNAAGTRIPNVTTISKLIQSPEGLIHWAWKLGTEGRDYKQVRDEAATAGHACHSMIECYIRGVHFKVDETLDEETLRLAKQGFSAFKSWIDSTKFELLRSEVRIISELYQYGGRLDCIASVNDEPCIVDWKTSGGRKVQESWLPQIAAYRQGWNENHRAEPVTGCHLMVLAKADAGFSHHYFPPSTIDTGWKAFLACLELYDRKKEIARLI